MLSITERFRSRQNGFTIVELMIGLVLGLIVVGGSLALFSSTRTTSSMSGHMADVQSEGRIALDALARDLRAAGDFGCWPVTNAPINKLNDSDVLSVDNGGLLGYDSGSSVKADNGVYGETSVAGKNPDENSSVVATYGVRSSLSNIAAGHAMTGQTDDLVVNMPVQVFQTGDIAVVTDCVNWSKFQITGVQTDTAADTQTLAHAAVSTSDGGGGNSDSSLGELFGVGATVGRLDAVWWYIGTQSDGDKGLYRLSARDGAPQLVSGRVNWLQIKYGVDTNSDDVVDETVDAADVTNWNNVMVANIELCVRSSGVVNAVPQTSETCGGTSAPTDRHLYLDLHESVSLRNQNP